MPKFLRNARTYLVSGACIALAATGFAVLSTSAPAQAHGNVNDPISRNYRCLAEWGSRFQDRSMAAQDPMCWQAWQADPNAMWNWNGLLRDGLAGQYRERIPDGTICSGGGADNGRYNALDTPGAWVATPKPAQFRLNLVDQASHSADFIDVYVSTDGYDPLTERLAWDDIALVGHLGQTRNNGIVDPKVGGVAYGVDVDASGYPGRRLLLTIWKASHSDQTYFLCSDVVIGAGGVVATTAPAPSPSPTVPPTTAATTAPATTASAPTANTSTAVSSTTRGATAATATRGTTTTGSAAASATGTSTPPVAGMPAGDHGCTATYAVHGSWPGGLIAMVVVTAGAAPINNWHVMWDNPPGQVTTQLWNGTVSPQPGMSMVDSAAYNGRLGAGQSATFGLLASWRGSVQSPAAVSCIAG